MFNFNRKDSIAGLCFTPGQVAVAISQGEQPAISAKFNFEVNVLVDDPATAGLKLRSELQKANLHVKRCLVVAPLGWFQLYRLEVDDTADDLLPELVQLEVERLSLLPADEFRCTFVRQGSSVLAISIGITIFKRLIAVCHEAGINLIGLVPAVALFHNDTGAVIWPSAAGVDFAFHRDGSLPIMRQLCLPPIDNDWKSADFSRRLRLAFSLTFAGAANEMNDSRLGIIAADRRGEAVLEAFAKDDELSVSLEAIARDADSSEVLAAVMATDLAEQNNIPKLFLSTVASHKNWRETLLSFSRVYRRALIIAVCLLVTLVMLPIWRHVRVLNLEKELVKLEPDIMEAQKVRDRYQQLAPWYDRTPAHLEVILGIAKAFPESGDVWTTSVTINSNGNVRIEGKARSDEAWLNVLAALGEEFANIRPGATRTDARTGSIRDFVLEFPFPSGTTQKGR